MNLYAKKSLKVDTTKQTCKLKKRDVSTKKINRVIHHNKITQPLLPQPPQLETTNKTKKTSTTLDKLQQSAKESRMV